MMRTSGKRSLDAWTIITLICVLLFAVFLLYPLLQVFIKSVMHPERGFTLEFFQKFFSKPFYTKALMNSFKVTLCVTVLTILVGTPLAYIMKTMCIKGKAILETLIILSLLSPPFIGAYSWILLLGRGGAVTGWLNRIFSVKLDGIYGFGGILLVFTLQLFPLIYLYVSGALKKMDHSLIEAAESFGCTGIQKMRRVVLPLILPTLLAGGLLVFMRSLADFGTPMLMGEGYRVMPVLIFNEFISEMGGTDGFAAALSVIMVVITTLLFLGQRYIAQKKSFSMSATNPGQEKKATGWKNILAHLYAYVLVFLAILPQCVVIYTSFKNTNGRLFAAGYSLGSYRTALEKMGNAILNTYLYSLIAVAVIIVLGCLIAYVTVRRKNPVTTVLDTVSMLPYITPGSVLGIAILLAFNKKPMILTGTAFILILVFVVRRLPYTIRSSSAILGQISTSVEEAAISLGASQMKTFVKITAPMMAPGVISGAILSWMTIISELSASVILYVVQTKTLTIAIYTEVVRGNYGVAAALSTILTATTILTLLVFFRVSGRRDINM